MILNGAWLLAGLLLWAAYKLACRLGERPSEDLTRRDLLGLPAPRAHAVHDVHGVCWCGAIHCARCAEEVGR